MKKILPTLYTYTHTQKLLLSSPRADIKPDVYGTIETFPPAATQSHLTLCTEDKEKRGWNKKKKDKRECYPPPATARTRRVHFKSAAVRDAAQVYCSHTCYSAIQIAPLPASFECQRKPREVSEIQSACWKCSSSSGNNADFPTLKTRGAPVLYMYAHIARIRTFYRSRLIDFVAPGPWNTHTHRHTYARLTFCYYPLSLSCAIGSGTRSNDYFRGFLL